MLKNNKLNVNTLSSLIKHSKEGIIVLNYNGNLIAFNPIVKYLMGFSQKEKLTLKKLKEIFNSLNIDAYLNKKYFVKKKVTTVNFNLNDNHKHVLSVSGFPLRLSLKNHSGYVIIIGDITKEKETEQNKTDFLSVLSHELRTPLSIVNEGISMILEEITGNINERQKKILDLSKINMGRLTRIIENLTDFANIEKGTFSIRYSFQSMDKLAYKAIEKHRNALTENNIKIKFNIDKKLPTLLLDHEKILRVFYYLLDNAIKYSPQHSEIILTIKKRKNGILSIISDKGPGISPHNLKDIFNGFTQIHRQSGGGEKGLGLGLSIAKKIIDLHKGKIWVKSNGNKGSSVYFFIPFNDIKILIIDDDKNFVKTMKVLLENENYKTIEAYDGKTGLELAQSKVPDLICLDINLPYANGYEVLGRLKQFKNTQNIPIIILTGKEKVNEEEIQKISSPRIFKLQKPFVIDTLLNNIKKSLISKD